MRGQKQFQNRIKKNRGYISSITAAAFFFLVVASILTGTSAFGADKVYQLGVAHFAPIKHHLHTRVYLPFVKELETESGGRLKVTLYPAGAMGKPSAMFDSCRKSIVDLAMLFPMYTPGVFLLSDVVSLPFAIPSADIGHKVVSELLEKKLLDKAFYDEIVSWMSTTSPYQFFLKKKVAKLEDLKGLKLRTPGGMQTEGLKSLGATPVTVPGAEFTTAMERGIISGGVVDFSSGPSYKLQDMSKQVVKADMGVAISGIIMNRKTFEGLPQDLQKVIDTACKNLARNTAISYDSADKVAAEVFKKANVEIYQLDPNEKMRWMKACEPTYNQWITNMKSKGHDSEKIYAAFKEIVKKYGIELPR